MSILEIDEANKTKFKRTPMELQTLHLKGITTSKVAAIDNNLGHKKALSESERPHHW
jgi:hypothetical protein